MKKVLLPLLVLIGCKSAPVEDPAHSAISALLKKSMDDPASYQPVSWSKPEVRSVHDSVAAYKYTLASQIITKNKLIYIDSSSVAQNGGRGSYVESMLKSTRASLAAARRERDSLYQALHQPFPSPDTARLGYSVTHAFRAKNKFSALVLDSAEFFVDRKGRIYPR